MLLYCTEAHSGPKHFGYDEKAKRWIDRHGAVLEDILRNDFEQLAPGFKLNFH
jgi:hypothetical protein